MLRKIAKEAIEKWAAANPRQVGVETVRQYRKRFLAGVVGELKPRYGNTMWWTWLLQFLPLLIEWFVNRRERGVTQSCKRGD